MPMLEGGYATSVRKLTGTRVHVAEAAEAPSSSDRPAALHLGARHLRESAKLLVLKVQSPMSAYSYTNDVEIAGPSR